MKPGSQKRPWWVTSLHFIGVGWFIALAIVLGTLMGVWLDARLGSSPIFIILGLLVGVLVAFYGTYRLVVTFLVGSTEQNERGPKV